MSLELILNHIINQAQLEREKIIQEAERQAEGIIREAKLEAGQIYQEMLSREEAHNENLKQRLIINARLQQKKRLLEAKQESISAVFKKLKAELKKEKFKKEQVFHDRVHEVTEDTDFHLNNFRLDNESTIAGMLFP